MKLYGRNIFLLSKMTKFHYITVIFLRRELWHFVKKIPEVLTKHIRRSLDKAYTKKSWQNIYDEVYFLDCCQNVMLSPFSKEVRLTEGPRDPHENSRGEKLGEKTGEISPLHLKYIFAEFCIKFWVKWHMACVKPLSFHKI